MVATELPPQIEREPTARELLPLDKTWTRVMIALDSKHGFNDTTEILAPFQHQLPVDTTDYLRAQADYRDQKPIRIGEGGANYRDQRYRSLLEGTPREFVKTGSLLIRAVYEQPDMITLALDYLLLLDNKTTQFASARMIWDEEAVFPPETIAAHFKLQVVADAITHWYTQRELGLPWQPRLDSNIVRQAEAYQYTLRTGTVDPNFYVEQAEDYCFARAYGLMTAEEAHARWPALKSHESNRIESMERAIKQMEAGEIIDVNDHRVVQAMAMRFGLGRNRFKYPDCVSKSWPQFWAFIESSYNAMNASR